MKFHLPVRIFFSTLLASPVKDLQVSRDSVVPGLRLVFNSTRVRILKVTNCDFASLVLSSGSTSDRQVAVLLLWSLMTLKCWLCCTLRESKPPPYTYTPPKCRNPCAAHWKQSGPRTIGSGNPRKSSAGPISSWRTSGESFERRAPGPRGPAFTAITRVQIQSGTPIKNQRDTITFAETS
jgi:hypothetical protein